MMEAFYGWDDEIMDHILQTGLKNLSEYKDADGTSPYGRFTDITRSRKSLKPFSYSDFKHGDDFLFISHDLMYITAILELVHPKINNAVKESGAYHQSLEDHIYLRYAGFGVHVIYSFWDRVGDLLDMFFDTGLKGDVYLARVLNNFPKAHRSQTYDALVDLYKDKVEPILTDRHSVVHYFTMKAKYFWGTMEQNLFAEFGSIKIVRTAKHQNFSSAQWFL